MAQEKGGSPDPQGDPPVALFSEKLIVPSELQGMVFYRRHLPHLYSNDQPIFVTWRLHSTLPSNRCFATNDLSFGKAFVAMDRLLDEARTGPSYLRDPALAAMIVDAIRYNEAALHHYRLHAYVVMPNHVHLLLDPLIPLPKLMKSLKGITAKRANEMLTLTGQPFWQEESYDRLVRDAQEFRRVQRYIEQNPVKAGLVRVAEEFPWSSAGATGGSRSGTGVPPYRSSIAML